MIVVNLLLNNVYFAVVTFYVDEKCFFLLFQIVHRIYILIAHHQFMYFYIYYYYKKCWFFICWFSTELKKHNNQGIYIWYRLFYNIFIINIANIYYLFELNIFILDYLYNHMFTFVQINILKLLYWKILYTNLWIVEIDTSAMVSIYLLPLYIIIPSININFTTTMTYWFETYLI